MSKVLAQEKTIKCVDADGLVARHPPEKLRKFLPKSSINLYNGSVKVINCRGIRSCGTCAVKVEDEVSMVNGRDQARCLLPFHSPTKDLHLACQTQVLGNVKVTKLAGFGG